MGNGPSTGGRSADAAGRMLAAALVGLAVTLASACATVPDGGPVTTSTIAQKGADQGVFIQMIPSGPQPGWDPGVIVSGFLLASASFTGNHAIARKYLTPSAARTWRPGSSVAEFADTPAVAPAVVQGNVLTVRVGGQLLGTISSDGQYQAAEPGDSYRTWSLTVARVRGQWRIEKLPDVLLLSKRDVSRAFRSRDLYFFDPSLSNLVPDPVYVPAEASQTELVKSLVDALRQGPEGWLAVGTRTAFPRGTTLLGTSVTGSTATVNLGGRAAAAGDQQRDEMATQLLQTLASAPAYPQPDVPSVQSVVFEINGQPIRVSCATGNPPARQLSLCEGPVPQVRGSLYYVDSHGRVATLSAARPDAPVPGVAGTGEVPFGQIAVSPDEMSVAGVAGRKLYTGSLTQDAALTVRLTDANFTTLSWDNAGGLWVSGRSRGQTRVWWLDHGARPVEVSLPAGLGPVTLLRVAPDGVRLAIVTGSGKGSRLWLAAIERPGDQVAIGDPVPIGTDISNRNVNFAALTWYDTGDVIVLTQPSSGPALYEVPVDGSQSRQVSTELGTLSITASGAGQLVAERDDDTLIQLPDPGGSIWGPAGAAQSQVIGKSPVYPG